MEQSFRNLDLNLLKVLSALIAERSVTRAAATLGRTQPAMSNALHRLRILLGDELFVRGPKGLALTPRTEALCGPLAAAIAVLEDALFDNAVFDPANASGLFRISTPDRLSLAVVPRLFERLRTLAPHMALQVRTADRQQATDLVNSDQIDLAIGWLDEKPVHLNAALLMEEDLYCVLRREHPLLKPKARFDMRAILSYPHLVVSATGGLTAIFDDLLQKQNLKRDALVVVSNFTTVPHLLARSDMIGVFTQLAAEVFANSFGLMIRRVPSDVGKIVTNMVWHSRNHGDSKHVWLREQVKMVYQLF